jgi:hypothetical protein
MRKCLLLLPAVVLATVAFFGATASSASASAIYATGGGWVSVPLLTSKHYIHFDISAHSGPQGDHGQFGFTINDPTAPLDVKVNVDCLNVFPFLGMGVAWGGGAITKVSPQPNYASLMPGDQLVFYAVDGGQPSGTAPVDEFIPDFGAPQLCKTLTFTGYNPEVTQGNVNISAG